MELASPVGAELDRATATGLILDDDSPGAVSLQPVGATSRRAVIGQMVVLQVRARTAAGEPDGRAEVRWETDGEGELLAGPVTTTDGDGVASQRVRLGAGPGHLVVRAAATGGDETVLFQITVTVE